MPQGNRSPQPPTPHPRRRSARNDRSLVFLIIFLVLLWLVFSGKFDALHLGYGLLSIVLVTVMCRGLLVGPEDRPENEVLPRISWGQILLYPFWLLWQILVANLQVAALILHPRLPIAPVMLEFRSGLESDLARVTLGNSITLTPGTLTVRIEGDHFLVHSLHPRLAGGLLDGSMQHQVAAAFGEPQVPVAQMDLRIIEDVEAWLEGQP